MFRRHALGLLTLLLALCYTCLRAQNITGSFTGTVYDTNGATVVGAAVQAVNAGTGVTLSAVSDKDGNYTFSNLQPGSYTLVFAATGFETVKIAKVVLLVNATAREDVHLKVGSSTETISVEGGAPVISTDDSAIGTVIDQHAMSKLLVNGRTVDQLVATTSGNTGDSATAPALAGALHWGGTYFTVDGGTFNDMGNGAAAYSYATNLTTLPSTDTVQEVKVQANLANAEFEGGAAVVVVTKSGTNAFHGTLTEFNRNRDLAAFDRFAAAGSTKPTFNRNEFGGTVGGPIYKNKTFFFFSLEEFMQRKAAYDTATVPTALMRTGDFSELLALSTPITIKNPYTGIAYTNNKIPSIDSRASTLLGYYPTPTITTSLTNNFTTSVATKYDVQRWNLKIDHTLNAKNALSGGGSYSAGNPYFVALGTPSNYGNWSNAGYITQSLFVRDLTTFTPTLINEARVGYFSHRSIRVGQNTGFSPASLFPGLYYQAGMIGGLPTINMSDANYSYQGISDYGGSGHGPQTTIQVTDNLTKQWGRHTIKAGLVLNFSDVITKAGTNSSVLGTFGFNGTYSGNAFADFLLGYVYSSVRAAPTVPVDLRFRQNAFYGQDEWKVNSQLTLNYGVRYSLQTVPEEQHGDMTNFDFNTGQLVIRTSGGQMGSGVNKTILGTYPYTTSEQLGWGDRVIEPDYADVGPRLGFAYRLTDDGKTVLRGGYGIFYNFIPMYIGINQLANTNYPFTLSQSYSATAGSTPSLTLAAPFTTTASITANPTIYSVDHNLRNTRVQQWNLTLEQELPSNIGLRISYVGSKTTQAPWYLYQMNYPKVQKYGTVQANRPYQPWGTIYGLVTKGASETNELQVEVTKRYAHGLYYQGSYTWDKTLNNVPLAASPQNPYNPAGDRGAADGVYAHTGYINASWDLPAKGNGVLGGVIKGWTLSGMALFHSGLPFTPTFTAVTSSAYTGWLATRPDVVPGMNPYAGAHTMGKWFNSAAFQRPTAFTYGNARRNSLFGPHQTDIHLSLQREWSLFHGIKLMGRMDAFNVLNHPVLYTPAANITNSTAGQITSTNQDNREIQFGSKLTF